MKKPIILLVLTGILFLLPKTAQATVFADTYDTSTPAGSDSPTEADDRMRETKAATQERLNVCMYFPLSGTEVSDSHTGEFRFCLFHAPIVATPTVAADHGDLRIADVAGKAELHWTDEDEQEIQLTSAGGLYSSTTLDVVGNATVGGTLDVTGATELIGVATIADASLLKTSAAPTTDAMIANKLYVDDFTTMVPAVTGAGTGYAGEQSVTFANGLIWKTGEVAIGTNATVDVVYGTPFPTAYKWSNTSFKGNDITTGEPSSSQPKSGSELTTLQVTNADFAVTIYWEALGY